MTDYVLVHGAWRAGWLWKRVRPLLAAEGHRVFTPTLTGLGDRSHLLSRDVGLETHIDDIINLMIWEEVEDAILVGHSYAGVVVRHVADRMPERIRSLIYVDAFVPDDGRSINSYLPDSGQRHREIALAHGDGWKVPTIPALFFGDNAADAEWIDLQCTMHPLSTFETPAALTGACDSVADIGYILANGWDGPMRQFYDAASERDWWREELPCGHDVMIDMPQELAALLLKRA
ncbi:MULTISPECIES: alpha/beta hydrolase [Rhodomicrobium]|uniref:alpha/beta fold hydrolase n=1 Tax=Rhodomicrobium TaxID=1068 RepID=UPI000B4B8FDB|nr:MULTISPECIES: alpha/beta hydrolase [Rhodomicrobium]